MFGIGFPITMASQRVDAQHTKLDRPALKECYSSFDSSLRYVSVMFFGQIIVLEVLRCLMIIEVMVEPVGNDLFYSRYFAFCVCASVSESKDVRK